ncbi:MAG: GntR family transcriptional regulator [Alphaproteobacteria bacterium]|nr:GntR family transcriptional regulator [Alphaproteobacteria bacterium]
MPESSPIDHLHAEPDAHRAAPVEPPPPSMAEASPTLAQVVAARLRDMIAQNDLPPGTRIRERTIAEQLAVSRTPLREALRILATERLVELLPNRGAMVCAPEPKHVKDLLSVLKALEALAGEQAADNASDAEIAEVRALHYEMLACFERKDRLAYFKFNQAIHHAIVRAAHNEPLAELHSQTNARLYRIRYISNLKNGNWHTAIEEHERILDAFTRRDAKALSQILHDHLGSTWTKVNEIGF